MQLDLQLDFFNDSHSVLLRNDVILAIERWDASAAHAAWETLCQQYPRDDCLSTLQVLIKAVAERSQTPFQTHAALHDAQETLLIGITPAAQRNLGVPAAALWLRVQWQELAKRAAPLAYSANHSEDHAARLWLRAENWQAAAEAVATIVSWRRIPTPLFWMLQARLHTMGLQANWAMLAELAWLSPSRLDELVTHAADPTLQQLMKQFQNGFEGGGDTDDLAWFPAWLLTERPNLASFLTLAQPSQHSDPERAMRVLIELLGLERQGRQNDLIEHRKTLRDLSKPLYQIYMRTR